MQELHPTGLPEAENYLFRSTSSTVEFVVIEEDMSQLNDYCVHFLEATQIKIRNLQHESEHGTGGTFKDLDGYEIELSDDDVQDGAFMGLDAWQDTGDFLARANVLLLLACFTEKSLIHLCVSFGEKSPRTRAGQSKLDACIEFLRESCGFQFEDTPASVVVREECRKIRNAFAHGEWDRCRELVASVNLNEAFAAVSGLLTMIERGAELTKQQENH